MNRQEAIAELKRMASTIEWDYPLDAQIAIEKAVEALSGPTPDPDTGLVACGCGGKAGFHYSVIVDNDCYVECGICGVHSKVALCEEKARDAWNTAMSGATGPDAGEMAPNGDEGAES
jgi:hypothetical protein